jgi:hypothetical protein
VLLAIGSDNVSALKSNPIEDLQNFRKIKMRFKQGFLMEP